MADRSNLLYNPSFQYGLLGWTQLNSAVLTMRQGLAFYGNNCVRVDVSNTLADSGIQYGSLINVIPGRRYAVLAHVMVPAVVPAVRDAYVTIRMVYYDAAGNQLFDSQSKPIQKDSVEVKVTQRDGWVRISNLDTPPIGAYKMRYQVIQKTPNNYLDPLTGLPTAESYFFLDACLVEEATTVGGYIDTFSPEDKTSSIQRALTPLQSRAVETVPLRADVVLNNLILNTIDEDNVVWVCTNIEGWWGHSTPEGPDIERGFEDGSYDVSGRYQARSLTLSGVFLPPDPSVMPKARDRLISATNIIRRGAWLRTSEDPTRASFVRLAGRPNIETVNARGRTTFEIPLRAADPVKYHWNDLDPNGITNAFISANTGYGKVTNIGTSDVTATFRLRGPMGPGSSIYNQTTDETITLTRPLRRKGGIATVVEKQVAANVATLGTDGDSGLFEGDTITVSGVGAPYDSAEGQFFTVLSATREDPYTVSYAVTSNDTAAISGGSGSISLYEDDILELDTYEKSVLFNKNGSGQRSRLTTMVDWIKLAPGDNYISLDTKLTHFHVSHKYAKSGKVTLSTQEGHQLLAGESIAVKFPTDAALSRKSLTNNVATVTTEKPHGFSKDDYVTITSVATASLEYKTVAVATGAETKGTVTIKTLPPTWDFQPGDSITVTLPVNENIIKKAYDGQYVTLTTEHAVHGFAPGDLVNVILPTTATIAQKELTANQAKITFTGEHNFSIGDSIEVDLPYYTATAVSKSIVGDTVTITTSAAHNFTTGDLVTTTLPASATLTGNAVYSGAPNYTATVTTGSNHGFEVGDIVTVNINNNSYTNPSVYTGQKIIQSKTANTLTFTSYAGDTASTAAVGASAAVTNVTNSTLNGARRATVISPTQYQFSTVT